ncbi:MAG: GWxTD domain-containing protein [Bacteroidota bacterium]
MLKRWVLGLFLLLMLGQAQAEVTFYMDICRFQSQFNNKNTFVAINLAVDGSSLFWKAGEGDSFQATVNLDIALFLLLGNDTLKSFEDNINLLSLPVEDSTQNQKAALIPYVQNIEISPERSPGKYLLRVIARDVNKLNGKASMALREFEMSAPTTNSPIFSDLAFITSMGRIQEGEEEDMFSRPQGSFKTYVIPFPTSGIYINQDTLKYYVEFYNANMVVEKNFAIRSRIKQGDTFIQGYTKVEEKKRASFRNYHNSFFDISELESQTYYLIVDLLGEDNRLIRSTSKKFIVVNQRVEPEFYRYVANKDVAGIFSEYTESQLETYLQTLSPISTEQENSFIQALQKQTRDSYEMKKNYLYSFWSKRVRTGQSVAGLWRTHLAALAYTDQYFRVGNQEGWETDRGRIFLKYGIPSDTERYPSETGVIPYEIWRYDRLDAQTNVEFVFADMGQPANDYQLLHSNKYNEINNPNWKAQLLNRGRVPALQDFEEDRTTPNQRYDTKLIIRD